MKSRTGIKPRLREYDWIPRGRDRGREIIGFGLEQEVLLESVQSTQDMVNAALTTPCTE